MSELDDLISQIEEREAYEDMHFSLYYIPQSYHEKDDYLND